MTWAAFRSYLRLYWEVLEIALGPRPGRVAPFYFRTIASAENVPDAEPQRRHKRPYGYSREHQGVWISTEIGSVVSLFNGQAASGDGDRAPSVTFKAVRSALGTSEARSVTLLPAAFLTHDYFKAWSASGRLPLSAFTSAQQMKITSLLNEMMEDQYAPDAFRGALYSGRDERLPIFWMAIASQPPPFIKPRPPARRARAATAAKAGIDEFQPLPPDVISYPVAFDVLRTIRVLSDATVAPIRRSYLVDCLAVRRGLRREELDIAIVWLTDRSLLCVQEGLYDDNGAFDPERADDRTLISVDDSTLSAIQRYVREGYPVRWLADDIADWAGSASCTLPRGIRRLLIDQPWLHYSDRDIEKQRKLATRSLSLLPELSGLFFRAAHTLALSPGGGGAYDLLEKARQCLPGPRPGLLAIQCLAAYRSSDGRGLVRSLIELANTLERQDSVVVPAKWPEEKSTLEGLGALLLLFPDPLPHNAMFSVIANLRLEPAIRLAHLLCSREPVFGAAIREAAALREDWTFDERLRLLAVLRKYSDLPSRSSQT